MNNTIKFLFISFVAFIVVFFAAIFILTTTVFTIESNDACSTVILIFGFLCFVAVVFTIMFFRYLETFTKIMYETKKFDNELTLKKIQEESLMRKYNLETDMKYRIAAYEKASLLVHKLIESNLQNKPDEDIDAKEILSLIKEHIDLLLNNSAKENPPISNATEIINL